MEPRVCEEVGDRWGGVSVDCNGRLTVAPGVGVSVCLWPSCKKSSASSASFEMSLGGVGGRAGNEEKTDDDEPGDDMVARTSNSKKKKSRRCMHVVRWAAVSTCKVWKKSTERESELLSRLKRRAASLSRGWSKAASVDLEVPVFCEIADQEFSRGCN